MATVQPCREMFGAYSEALLAWLAEGNAKGNEARLLRARELGRTALNRGVRASEMLALHHDSVRQILALMQSSDECRRCEDPAPCHGVHLFLQSLTPHGAVAAAGVFFAESMAPFEAKERELRRSNVALRYQNNKLEGDVHRFTQMVYNEGMQLLAAARLAMAEATVGSQPAL